MILQSHAHDQFPSTRALIALQTSALYSWLFGGLGGIYVLNRLGEHLLGQRSAPLDALALGSCAALASWLLFISCVRRLNRIYAPAARAGSSAPMAKS